MIVRSYYAQLSFYPFDEDAMDSVQLFTASEIDRIGEILDKKNPNGINAEELNDLFRFYPEKAAAMIGLDWDEEEDLPIRY